MIQGLLVDAINIYLYDNILQSFRHLIHVIGLALYITEDKSSLKKYFLLYLHLLLSIFEIYYSFIKSKPVNNYPGQDRHLPHEI